MLRRVLAGCLLWAGCVLLWHPQAMAAYTMDGSLSDWGITPFSDWTPWNSSVDYTEEDWTVCPHYSGYIGHGDADYPPYPWGGEKYDIEAMFFDDDPNYLYFAMVTSFPQSGRDGIKAGDIAFGFGAAGSYDYAIKVQGLSSSNYGLNTVSIKKLGAGESWINSVNADANPVYLGTGVGTEIGLAELYYWNAESVYNEPGTSLDTWILEGRMDRSLFSGLTDPGDYIRLHNTMLCGNDYINLLGDFDKPIIPEPATMGLLGFGLLGLFGLRRRK